MLMQNGKENKFYMMEIYGLVGMQKDRLREDKYYAVSKQAGTGLKR